MRLFRPCYSTKRAYDLTAERLRAMGVSALLLDVDNTLTTHGCPEPDERILLWLEEMRSAGIRLMLLSNNRKKRVQPFAEQLGLLFEAGGAKPLPGGFRRCCERLALPKQQVAMVGDQFFTDIAGANCYGIQSILVEPLLAEGGFLFRLKRAAERPLDRRYRHAGE